jgi:F-type H+-transporting ATPase subunit epsilon
MQCQIAMPHSQLFTGKVEMVTLPTVDGEIGVLKGHMSLVTLLMAGTITVQFSEGESQQFEITEGIAHITPAQISVMVAKSAA